MKMADLSLEAFVSESGEGSKGCFDCCFLYEDECFSMRLAWDVEAYLLLYTGLLFNSGIDPPADLLVQYGKSPAPRWLEKC